MEVGPFELRQLAASYLRKEQQDHTLQATALVHEAYLRLVDQKTPNFENRSHFFGVAAQMMRRILVDHARSHLYAKRGGGAQKLTLDEALSLPQQERDLDLVALDDALQRLEALDAQQAKIIELRFFGGLSIEETADALNLSPMTVKRRWASAKVWLHRALNRAEA